MKLTIITVCYNNAKGLRKTIESVMNQGFRDYEHVIIDGGSTDGTIDVIKEYKDHIAYWVSEKDGGIYNAMNKGVAAAKGEYLQFLNSSDFYYDNKSLSTIFERDLHADIIYADFANADKSYVWRMPEEVTFRFFYKGCIQHQASIIKKKVFDLYGGYDESVPIIADWDHFIRMIFLHSVSTQYIRLPFICFDFEDSMSNKPGNFTLIAQTRASVLNKYFAPIVRDMEYINNIEKSTTYRLVKKITGLRSKLGV